MAIVIGGESGKVLVHGDTHSVVDVDGDGKVDYLVPNQGTYFVDGEKEKKKGGEFGADGDMCKHLDSHKARIIVTDLKWQQSARRFAKVLGCSEKLTLTSARNPKDTALIKKAEEGLVADRARAGQLFQDYATAVKTDKVHIDASHQTMAADGSFASSRGEKVENTFILDSDLHGDYHVVGVRLVVVGDRGVILFTADIQDKAMLDQIKGSDSYKRNLIARLEDDKRRIFYSANQQPSADQAQIIQKIDQRIEELKKK